MSLRITIPLVLSQSVPLRYMRSFSVVLHLNGERRLYGWPEEWPSRPEEGHFRIAEGECLIDDRRVPATGVSALLIPAGEVEMVEFLKMEFQSEPQKARHGKTTNATTIENTLKG